MYLTPSDPEIEPVHQNVHKSVKVILHKKTTQKNASHKVSAIIIWTDIHLSVLQGLTLRPT